MRWSSGSIVRRTSGRPAGFRGPIPRSVWARLEDAIVEANFWILDERGGCSGLDGSTWRFAGRPVATITYRPSRHWTHIVNPPRQALSNQ